MQCWIKISKKSSDSPEKWIKNRKIEICNFQQKNDVSSNRNWLESKNGPYNWFTKLDKYSTIYVFDDTNYLKYKFIIGSKYSHLFHGYLIQKAFECIDKIYQFKNENLKIKRFKWAAKSGKILNKCINVKMWKEIDFNSLNYSKIKQEVLTNLSNYKIEQKILTEGKLNEKTIKIHERNSTLRIEYIKRFGVKCHLCGKEFKKFNNTEAIIDVHHLTPIYHGERTIYFHLDKMEKYLLGVCPNCHRWIHSIKNYENFTYQELKEKYDKTHN